MMSIWSFGYNCRQAIAEFVKSHYFPVLYLVTGLGFFISTLLLKTEMESINTIKHDH